MLVAGLDACKEGWVGVALQDGELADAALLHSAADALDRWAEAQCIVIDIPIGLPGDGDVGYPRMADGQARAFLQRWRAGSSVFPAPPATVLEARSHLEAVDLMKAACGVGISRQAFALAPKILEVRALASSGSRILEGHPEVTFRKLTSWPSPVSRPRASRKKSWNGIHERQTALHSIGVHLPDLIESAGEANADDVVDAAAMAWTAWSIARNTYGTYPDPPEAGLDGHPVAIHFPV